MNNDQLDDLKQFIDSKISQSEEQLSEKIGSRVSLSEQNLGAKIDALDKKMTDGFAGVGEAI